MYTQKKEYEEMNVRWNVCLCVCVCASEMSQGINKLDTGESTRSVHHDIFILFMLRTVTTRR